MDPYDENTNDLIDPRPEHPSVIRLVMDEAGEGIVQHMTELQNGILLANMELKMGGISTDVGPNPIHGIKREYGAYGKDEPRMALLGPERSHYGTREPKEWEPGIIFDRTPLFELIEYDPGDEEEKPDPANAPDWTITDLGDKELLELMEDETEDLDG